ncbi:MAG: RpiB/LacA/LacB family sugar-phosphate isomerase [Candidatus Uhrbacteria bacterium]
MPQKIYLGADHAGFERKEFLKKTLVDNEYAVIDLGNDHFDSEDDYPDFAFAVAKKVAGEPGSFGILICANGQGMCIVANRVPGIRGVLGYNTWAAETSRHDDDTNVLCLPGKSLSDEEMKEIVEVWLKTEFAGEERFVRRIGKIESVV